MIACRFAEAGCRDEAAYRVAVPEGCACFPDDRVQFLCVQHAREAEPLGSFEAEPIYEGD